MKQILCFGDSNTYGLIPGTTNQRYGWGTRWTSILDDKVRTKGYRVIEEGLCGRTTVFDDPFRTERRGTEMLPAILESHRPVDTIVLMLGTNDCKSVYSATPEVIGQGIEQLLDQINTVNPDAKILLVSPIYLGERIWEEDFIRNSIRILSKYHGICPGCMRKSPEEEIFLIFRLQNLPDREKPIRSIWMNWDIADLQMQFMKSLQDEA